MAKKTFRRSGEKVAAKSGEKVAEKAVEEVARTVIKVVDVSQKLKRKRAKKRRRDSVSFFFI